MSKCGSCGSSKNESSVFCSVCGQPADLLQDTKILDRSGRELRSILPKGVVFADRFRVENFLGQGGMGSVYRVFDLETNRTAALKMLSLKAASEPGFAERFAREIQLLTRISHPAIPRVLSAGTAFDNPYFVSEYVEGETLRKVIDRMQSLPAEHTAEIGATIAEALAEAHSHGIIHRDIKPENIIIGTSGTAFLIDFGIARATGPEMRSLTESGMLLGTPYYMAPEQIESHRVDERSDIYSLGVVLFECITGQLPFIGDTPFAIAQKHISTPPPRPRALKENVPPWLEMVVLRCLDKKPSKRPWTAAEVASLLRKSRSSEIRRKKLSNGDHAEEAPSELFGYSLRIQSRSPKKGWEAGMALYFDQILYKLVEIIPKHGGGSWEYRFVFWPQSEVLRKLVDFQSEIVRSDEKTKLNWAQKLAYLIEKIAGFRISRVK